MDLWVMAAVAGAGYLAKHWQNIFRDKIVDEPQSPSLIERIRDKTCPIKKFSQTRSETGKGGLLSELFAESSSGDSPIDREASCSSASNHEQEIGRHGYGNVSSQYMSRDGYELDGDMSVIPEDGTWEVGASSASRRSKKSLRSRRFHLQVIKPRSSLDSCLMAQMDREHVELEEFLRTPLSSPCTPSLRPFFVSDGKRLISKARGEFRNGMYNEVNLNVNNEVVGVPSLPQINPTGYSKQKIDCKNQMGKTHIRSNLVQFNARSGVSSGQALFCLGISIGILSTIIANKAELEKLKASLKQSENLVEDLQDELEMKDSLTVKELVNDDDSQDIHGLLSENFADEKLVCLKKDESISNIEAELEAELERLELSMTGSTFGGQFSQEFDPDLIPELVCGELQTQTIPRRSSSEPTLDRGSHTSTPTPQCAKDGVSPRELSLRLHEVIQSRLEERIMELETELANSQSRVHRLISERTNYWRDVSNSGSSSSRCSPKAAESHGPTQALVMNLSRDALDAYNEAFEELNKLELSEEEPSQIRVDGQTGSGKREEAVPISITGIPSSEDSPNDSYNSDDDDDMLLIRQIVEKARQGSPAILRAQKAMVSLNRDH